jgi:hypothetical protein
MVLPLEPERPARTAADVRPPDERDVDAERQALMHTLESGPSRPLTDAERRAAEQDQGVPERVYAPASKRVPKPPVPGDRAIVDGPESRVANPAGKEEGD